MTNEQVLSRMAEDLRLRGLAQGTQEDYLMHAELFLRYVSRPTKELTEEDIRHYLNYLLTDKKLKNSTSNTNLNYRQIPRLKQVRSLPEILTRSEVLRVFENASTLRNKAILMTVYSAGLRG